MTTEQAVGGEHITQPMATFYRQRALEYEARIDRLRSALQQIVDWPRMTTDEQETFAQQAGRVRADAAEIIAYWALHSIVTAESES